MPRYLSIAEQADWDSENSTEGDHFFFDIASEDISPENNILVYETAATRYPPGADMGPYRSTGSFETFCETSSSGQIFKMTFGNEEVPTSGATVSHVFTPVSAEGGLPYFTSYIYSDYPSEGWRKIINTGVESIEIAAEAGELMSLTVDVVGREELDDSSALSPTYSDVPFLTFTDGIVKIRGSHFSGQVESFSVTFENDIDTDALVLGRRDLPSIRLQGQTVEGSMDLAFDNLSAYKLFMGNDTAKTPQTHASAFQISLEAGWDTDEIPNISAHELNVYIPGAYFDTTEANIDTRDRIVQSVDFIGTEGTTTIDATDYTNSIVLNLINERSASF